MFDRYVRNKKGLSLVEVLLASALLLIVFTGFINAFYYSTNLRVNSQSRLQALLKAQACIEEIRGTRGTMPNQWSDIDELTAWLMSSEGYIENGTGVYKKDNVIIALNGNGPEIPEKLIPLSVQVTYADQMDRGKEKSVKLHTRLREF